MLFDHLLAPELLLGLGLLLALLVTLALASVHVEAATPGRW